MLAGPVGLVAAMAVGIAWSTWVPGAPQMRLAIGELLVSLLWGGAMAWTLADDRIWRATAVLVGTAIAGFALAIYLVCLTGTIAVFAREFQRWERPSAPMVTSVTAQAALEGAIRAHGGEIEHAYIYPRRAISPGCWRASVMAPTIATGSPTRAAV